MARIAYFDCPSGAAGDMIMGALVDAGAPFEALRDGLHGLDLTGWDLVRHEVRRGDFRATKVDVQIDAAAHQEDRKSTRLNSSHRTTPYAVCCLKKNTT